MNQEEKALQLHRDAIVVDSHCDTLLEVMGVDWKTNGTKPPRSLGEKSTNGQVDIPRLIEGGVDVQIFAAYIEPQYKVGPLAVKRGLQMIDAFHTEIAKYQDKISFATKYEEIMNTVKNHRIAALLSFEGGEPLSGDLGLLRMFYRLGIRAITLTWNQRNEIADGVGEKRTKSGLTEFGVQAIKEMNRLGIVIDVSHLSETGFYDVIETTNAPIIASHSNAQALCNHPRNLTDDQIRAVAKNGGVIGMCFSPSFIDQNEEQRTIDRLLDHVDHVRKLVGCEHLGIGSDFDGFPGIPKGLEDVTKMPMITKGLLARGYSEEDIRKILGGNYLRIFERILK
jgi:membrane dipeptidase